MDPDSDPEPATLIAHFGTLFGTLFETILASFSESIFGVISSIVLGSILVAFWFQLGSKLELKG